MKNHFIKYVMLMLYGICTTLLVACGGGGGSPGNTGFGGGGGGTAGGTGSSTTTGKIVVVLTDSAGAASNSVTGSNALTAKATVTTDTGAPVKNTMVTFTVSSTIAVLSPGTGTALTDDNGIAQISIKASGSGTGAAEVTAKATVGAAEVSAKAAFSVGASATATPTAMNFVAAVPTDNSIVIQGSGGSGRTEVALLTFKVVDSSNSGVPNVAVNFATQSSNPVSLVASSGKTDISGNVTVAVNSGTQPTTVRVIATVQGTAISAISDTVTVTTGQPTQAAFSLSLQKYYVEGWAHDNTQNTVTVLLADAFGAAVANGTQVVFTTDSGAIVGDGGARCLTTNGGCTVTWRSQNPRTSNGVVTVVATATNGTANLSTSKRFFNSGSAANVYQVSPGSKQGASTRTGAANAGVNLNFAASCDPQTIVVEIVDENGNPMPEGTTIAGADAKNAGLTAFPSTVLLGSVPIESATRGTVHNVTVTPAGCEVAGTKSKTGSILINVQTPLGGSTAAFLINLGTFAGN
ncbi:hypothetical protein ASE07_15175 [Noviherbaspirillum sp. Root189]|nr:hypothetical protein ASE07_15175 [Noviherbaspirillum sp. Root189]